MTSRGVFAGTFDPVHNGHLNIMKRAAKLFDELVIGVFDHGRPIKTVLFPIDERIALIEANITDTPNIRVMSFGGLLVDFAKQVNAPVVVRGLRVFSDFEFEFRMALANQRLAPEIEHITLMTREEHTFLSGSTVREIASFHGDVSTMVPPNVEKAFKAKFGY